MTILCLLFIPGGNAGIGRETAVDLARRGAHVVIACRNEEKAKRAVSEIQQKSGSTDVQYRLLDLADLESVKNFAAKFMQAETRLDVLINNAGTLKVRYRSHTLSKGRRLMQNIKGGPGGGNRGFLRWSHKNHGIKPVNLDCTLFSVGLTCIFHDKNTVKESFPSTSVCERSLKQFLEQIVLENCPKMSRTIITIRVPRVLLSETDNSYFINSILTCSSIRYC